MDAYNNPKSSKNFAVTTSHRAAFSLIDTAKHIATELKVPFVRRNGASLDSLLKIMNLDGIMVVSLNKISYHMSDGEFFFHPGLARLRIKEIKDGKTDQMIKAMFLKKGDSVLDCTLGLGTDAIVASYIVGKEGKVTGLESSAVISYIVKRGLSEYPNSDEDIVNAMRRVEVVETENKVYLSNLLPGSYDIIYFDPMFRMPRYRSPAMNTMRPLAEMNPVDEETIYLAKKAAVRRIVLKERRYSTEFRRLGFENIICSKYSPVAYGVIDLTGAVQ